MAASTDAMPAEDAATSSFGLLRELRAAERYLGNHPKAWMQWSPAVCRQALDEIEAVADFVQALKKRAGIQAPCETASH